MTYCEPAKRYDHRVLAELAKADINIFNVHHENKVWVIEYEYGWDQTYNGYTKTKWTKAVYITPSNEDGAIDLYAALGRVLREVGTIRAEL